MAYSSGAGLVLLALAWILLARGVFLPGATWASTVGFVCLRICAVVGVSLAIRRTR